MSGGVEALGLTALTGASSQEPPSLSPRNLACLKVLIGVAEMIGGGLGKSWFDVLEVLQSSSFVFAPTKRVNHPGIKKKPSLFHLTAAASPPQGSNLRVSSTGPSSFRDSNRSPLTARSTPLSSQDRPLDPSARSGTDSDAIQSSINHIFDVTSAELDTEGFTEFVDALCRLSEEMLGLPPSSGLNKISSSDLLALGEALPTGSVEGLSSPDPASFKRRRSSGLHMLKDNVRPLCFYANISDRLPFFSRLLKSVIAETNRLRSQRLPRSVP